MDSGIPQQAVGYLLSIVLLLSIWGAIRYRRHRLWYGLLTVALAVWLYYVLNVMNHS